MNCDGLPPFVCDAFGPQGGGETAYYMVSISDSHGCVRCDGWLVPLITLASLAALFVPPLDLQPPRNRPATALQPLQPLQPPCNRRATAAPDHKRAATLRAGLGGAALCIAFQVLLLAAYIGFMLRHPELLPKVPWCPGALVPCPRWAWSCVLGLLAGLPPSPVTARWLWGPALWFRVPTASSSDQ